MPLIHFVQKQPTGRLLVVSSEGRYETDDTFSALFSRWAMQGLSTWEGRILAVKRHFGWKAKVPLFCTDDLILMPIRGMRSPEGLFVNHVAVGRWTSTPEGYAEITFSNGTSMTGGASVPFRKRMEEARLVREYSQRKHQGQENAYMPKKPSD